MNLKTCLFPAVDILRHETDEREGEAWFSS